MLKNLHTFIALMLVATLAIAQTQRKTAEINYIRQELQRIIDVNLKYQARFHELVSEQTRKMQTPDATIVMCSDSRVDVNSINDTPAGQLFTIRNIGNQVRTAYGSVEYGVNHLHTPILLIFGHSGCGAVKAAMSDYSNESVHIRSELGTLQITPGQPLNQNIVNNVNYQVRVASDEFVNLLAEEKLIIIGMVYDIHNDFKLGYGKAILVNVNNETDPKALSENPYIKGLKHITILHH